MYLFVSKYLFTLVTPLMIPIELLVIGIIFLVLTKKQTAGKVFVILGLLVLIITGYRKTADMIVSPLERQYSPIGPDLKAGSLPDEYSGITDIVVLGGGHSTEPNLPITSRLAAITLVRLSEGIRLHNLLKGSRLVLSGGSVYDTSSDAVIMQDVAVAMGVDRNDIILETGSKDTEDEARLLAPLLGQGRFILVTSAMHMPRSMGLFMKLGMHPVAAPTDFTVHASEEIRPNSIFPAPESVDKVDRAVHEYIGELWSLLRGKA
ncbi:MAG TPA: ElyC/SanA/YdcF family protein [Bacteroidota bacterium]|nr:ElyC/SanA/YdcF family protein [Bacteroidota bacterium]